MRESELECDIDSDTELQRAFAEGRLKPGLNRLKAQAPPVPKTNNVAGLQIKLKDFEQKLSWEERLDVTLDPVQNAVEDEVNDDFKMELNFYYQAQAAVLLAIPRLLKLGIESKRPEHFFAEMAKTDQHMRKIREKVMEKKVGMERSQAARKVREAKQYGKKVQQEVTLKRQKEKNALCEAVKKYRKGKTNILPEILEDTNKIKQPNKKRASKDCKFGFGGQKKRSKRNTKESAAGPLFSKPKGKGKQKPTRPGKARRKQNKNKRK